MSSTYFAIFYYFHILYLLYYTYIYHIITYVIYNILFLLFLWYFFAVKKIFFPHQDHFNYLNKFFELSIWKSKYFFFFNLIWVSYYKNDLCLEKKVTDSNGSQLNFLLFFFNRSFHKRKLPLSYLSQITGVGCGNQYYSQTHFIVVCTLIFCQKKSPQDGRIFSDILIPSENK